MKRKLVKQAGQAVTITLPIEWIRKNNLKPGDEIDVDSNDNDLIIRSGKKIKGDNVKLDFEGFSKRLCYIYLNAAYAKGVDEIELSNANDISGSLIQNMGFAVVEQNNNIQKIKDISGVSSENLDVIFKRVFQMIISYYDVAINDIFGERVATHDDLRNRDIEINKFVLFLERSIIKSSHPLPLDGKILFAYSFSLEQIGDEVFRFWRQALNNKINKSKKVEEIIHISKKALEKSFEVYYHSDDKPVKDLMDLKRNIRNKFDCLKIDLVSARFCMHAVKIVELCTDLIQLALMKKL
jgi:phosphate uptake regulator